MTRVPDSTWDSWEKVVALQDACQREAEAEGLTGAAAYFRGCRIFEKHLQERKSYRERQAEWYEQQRARWSALPKLPTPEEAFEIALRQIAEGHNDPRRLAAETLERFSKQPLTPDPESP